MQGVDLTVVEAIDYFTAMMAGFQSMASKWGVFIGIIGLVWYAFKLMFSRMQVREFIFDSFSKALGFVIVMSVYSPATRGIASAAQSIGLRAGKGEAAITVPLRELREQLESAVAQAKALERGAKADLDAVMEKLNIEIPSVQDTSSFNDYLSAASDSVYSAQNLSRSQRKEVMDAIKAAKKSDSSKEAYKNAKKLAMINSVLVDRRSDASLVKNYVSLNLWLKKKTSSGNTVTYPYFSPQSVFNLGMLVCQIMDSKLDVSTSQTEEDAESGGWNFTKKIQESIEGLANNAKDAIINGLCCLIVGTSTVFLIIQYVMCVLEYVIVIGVGVFFIPFMLFDGTKDIPKKLIPVFTGFFVKLLVMNICMMFVFYLYLNFAVEQLQESAGISWVSFSSILMTVLLAYILTSNAPKIAVTILTGQPQLSMGEAVQAAGVMAAEAVGAKNIAGTAASPFAGFTKGKMQERAQQRAAGVAAAAKAESGLRERVTASYDSSTKEGSKRAAAAWKAYKAGHAGEIKGLRSQAGGRAIEKVKEQQRINSQANGGVAGGLARGAAHYAKSAAELKQTLLRGQKYQGPGNSVDYNRIAGEAAANSDSAALLAAKKDNQEKREEKKNSLPDNLTGGKRDV